MLRGLPPVAICPLCQQPGVHGDVDACLIALRAAVAAYRPAAK
jgi:hypothetical protein